MKGLVKKIIAAALSFAMVISLVGMNDSLKVRASEGDSEGTEEGISLCQQVARTNLSLTTDEGLTMTVYDVPENLEIVATLKDITYTEAANKLIYEEKHLKIYDSFAYAVALVDENGDEWQPEEGKTLKVKFSGTGFTSEGHSAATLMAFAIDDEVTALEKLGVYNVVDRSEFTFKTTSFTNFVVVNARRSNVVTKPSIKKQYLNVTVGQDRYEFDFNASELFHAWDNEVFYYTTNPGSYSLLDDEEEDLELFQYIEADGIENWNLTKEKKEEYYKSLTEAFTCNVNLFTSETKLVVDLSKIPVEVDSFPVVLARSSDKRREVVILNVKIKRKTTLITTSGIYRRVGDGVKRFYSYIDNKDSYFVYNGEAKKTELTFLKDGEVLEERPTEIGEYVIHVSYKKTRYTTASEGDINFYIVNSVDGAIDTGSFYENTVLYNGKFFDGGEIAPVVKLTADGKLINPDDYTVTFSYKKDGVAIDYVPVNVGNYSVSATIEFKNSRTESNIKAITIPEASFTIAKKHLAVSFNPNEKKYDGNAYGLENLTLKNAFSYYLNGEIHSLNTFEEILNSGFFKIKYAVRQNGELKEIEAPTEVGAYYVKFSPIAENAIDNYSLRANPWYAFEIVKADRNLSWTEDSFVVKYDDSHDYSATYAGKLIGKTEFDNLTDNDVVTYTFYQVKTVDGVETEVKVDGTPILAGKYLLYATVAETSRFKETTVGPKEIEIVESQKGYLLKFYVAQYGADRTSKDKGMYSTTISKLNKKKINKSVLSYIKTVLMSNTDRLYYGEDTRDYIDALFSEEFDNAFVGAQAKEILLGLGSDFGYVASEIDALGLYLSVDRITNGGSNVDLLVRESNGAEYRHHDLALRLYTVKSNNKKTSYRVIRVDGTNEELIGTFKTGKDGYVDLDLAEGTYKIAEMSGREVISEDLFNVTYSKVAEFRKPIKENADKDKFILEYTADKSVYNLKLNLVCGSDEKVVDISPENVILTRIDSYDENEEAEVFTGKEINDIEAGIYQLTIIDDVYGLVDEAVIKLGKAFNTEVKDGVVVETVYLKKKANLTILSQDMAGEELSGAAFVISDGKGYLAELQGAYEFVEDINLAKIFEVNDDGEVSTGYILSNGTYEIIEVKTPEGYNKADNAKLEIEVNVEDTFDEMGLETVVMKHSKIVYGGGVVSVVDNNPNSPSESADPSENEELTDIDEDDVAKSELPDESNARADIYEDNTPLSENPLTGDAIPVGFALAGLAALAAFVGVLLQGRRKK